MKQLSHYSLLMLFLIGCAGNPPMPAQASDSWESDYAKLLKKYVNSKGVDYKKWKSNKADLKSLEGVVGGIGKQTSAGKTKNEQLAYYINAYNAWILYRALDKYPTKGVLSGGDLLFFKKKNIKVLGKTTSFHKLENDVIRKKFNEPLIHFGLNCASVSCPPLHDEPYTAGNVNKVMEDAAKTYINKSSLGVKVSSRSKTVYLSEIFKWYDEDFGGRSKLLDYVNRYRSEKIPSDYKVKFMDYDWGLNHS